MVANTSLSHLQSGNHYYCVVTYGGVRLSVTASWDPVGMMITCAQRNVSNIVCSYCNNAIANCLSMSCRDTYFIIISSSYHSYKMTTTAFTSTNISRAVRFNRLCN